MIYSLRFRFLVLYNMTYFFFSTRQIYKFNEVKHKQTKYLIIY